MRMLDNVDWWRALGLLAIAVVVLFLWDTAFIYPLQILVVFFHELSHALAAVVTGGHVGHIEVVKEAGGTTWSAGGNQFIITSAGYLGSLLCGGVILLYAARSRWPRIGTMALGATLVFVTVWFLRPVGSFGFVFGLATGVALLAGGLWLAAKINELALLVVGMTSCLYAVYDIKSDILARPEAHSDAWMLAQQTGVPTLVWGLLWIVIAVGATFAFITVACKRK